jgi:hypothetical protein
MKDYLQDLLETESSDSKVIWRKHVIGHNIKLIFEANDKTDLEAESFKEERKEFLERMKEEM